MKLAVLITARLEVGLDVAQTWQERGAPGVTIIRAHGIHSLQEEVERGEIELPRMVMSMAGAMATIIDNMERNGLVVLSVVEDSQVDMLVDIANEILGDLYEPNTGILFVIDVAQAFGIQRHDRR